MVDIKYFALDIRELIEGIDDMDAEDVACVIDQLDAALMGLTVKPRKTFKYWLSYLLYELR